MAQRAGTTRTGPLVAAAAIGVALALAPAVFQMFTRTPAGGRMLGDFRPFMDSARLDGFAGHLDVIDAAASEVEADLVPAVSRAEAVAVDEVWADLPGTAAFVQEWPAIRDDMTGMLADIRANVDRFAAVDALPPFALFPWFFVGPGVLLAVLAVVAERRERRDRSAGGLVVAVAVVGLATAAAPLVFQMFSRAPAGARMIDDLRPLMTQQRVAEVQRYFLTIGGAEGEVRNRLVPRASAALPGDDLAARFAPTTVFIDRWPGIAADMAPMIGAMADHLDSFAGIDALPPFDLFPWFFVGPGLLVAGLAGAAALGRSDPTVGPAQEGVA